MKSAFVCGIFAAVSSCVLFAVHDFQPAPYMDEIFHVPQTASYCDGNWTSWDPMITTLPGLYVAANGAARVVALATGRHVSVFCDTFWLRSFNVLLSTGTCALLGKLSAALQTPSSDRQSPVSGGGFLSGAVLAFLPVLYFFSFLFYTDVISTLFVLLCYWLASHDRHLLAALAGAVSVCCRQTNVVWVGFAAAVSALRVLRKQSETYAACADSAKSLLLLIPEALRHLPSLLAVLWPYVPVVIGFAGFVFYNEGIVVGDRSHHQASFHTAQLCYFALFSAALASPHVLQSKVLLGMASTLWELVKQPILLLFYLSGILAMVTKGSYVHKYLTADNRHYTFYLWKKVLARTPLTKVALVPVYFAAFLGLFVLLRGGRHGRQPVWLLIFVLATAAVCVPQQLLELRYFIVPYLLLRLHMPKSPMWCVLLELLLYSCVNAATIYLFLFKPFKWPFDEGLQRFMW